MVTTREYNSDDSHLRGEGIETDLSLSDLPPSIEKPVTEKCKEQVFKILFHQCPILMPDKEEY